MAIYLQYKTPDINGGVTTENFVGQILISKFAFGIGRGVSSPIGGTSNREASTPSVSEIALSKLLDEATGGLIKEAYNGAGKATAVISFVRTDAGGGKAFLVYTLSDVMLSGWSTGAEGNGAPDERFSLNFTKVETKIIPQQADGSAGSPFVVTYDLGQQKLS
jgi:type VI secretion system secreted protein Hcp